MTDTAADIETPSTIEPVVNRKWLAWQGGAFHDEAGNQIEVGEAQDEHNALSDHADKLKAVVRDQVICHWVRRDEPEYHQNECLLCDGLWKPDDPESHQPGCLAAP